MAESSINCSRCSHFISSYPISEKIILGTNDVLIIGKFPKGKLKNFFQSPTARNLSKELEIININLNECSFTELCKCELTDRKMLLKAGKNCFYLLEKQIQVLKPKLIISIGTITKQIFENKNNHTFEMGKISRYKNYSYLPLYHPSPASPFGHRKNVDLLINIDIDY